MSVSNRKSIQDQIDQAAADPKKKANKFYRIAEADFLLQVTPAGVKSWCFRYTIKTKTRMMGLGPVHRISYDEALKRTRKAQVLLDEGIDPLAERDRIKAEQAAEQVQKMTFRACAEAFIASHRSGWKSAKHAAQWSATLEAYARTVANWHQPVELNNFGRQQAKATASEQNRQRQFGPCPKNGSLHRLGRYL